jgi:hypothetical protein
VPAPTQFDTMMAQRFHTGREDTLWSRFKRFMLGVSPS